MIPNSPDGSESRPYLPVGEGTARHPWKGGLRAPGARGVRSQELERGGAMMEGYSWRGLRAAPNGE